MRNVTITLEDETADWARVWSAAHQTSVSRMLGELLSEKMRAEEQYLLAMESYLSVSPIPLASAGQPYPSREAAHVLGNDGISSVNPFLNPEDEAFSEWKGAADDEVYRGL